MPPGPMTKTAAQAGFTLVELMVTVAIVAIIASVAIPIYTGYIERSNVQQALQRLAESRTRMEQYFMDHRVYSNNGACGFDVSTLTKSGDKFDMVCQAVDNNSYTIQARGKDTMTGFVYSINEQAVGTSSFTGHPTWGSGGSCWVTKPGEVCS